MDSVKMLMAYDGSGRRVSKTRYSKACVSDEADGVYAADWERELVAHYTGIGTEVRENYRDGSLQNARVVVNMPQGLGRYGVSDVILSDSEESSNTQLNEFYLKNHLGSTMMVAKVSSSNAPAEISAAYDYRAFGEQITLSEPTDKVTENFTGKERDDETQLNYFGARYLDPMLGLWISVDPKRQHFSPYTYGSNSPFNVYDPDGNKDLRIAVFYNYTQDQMPVNGALLVREELSKYINPAYDKLQIRSFGSKTKPQDILDFLNGADEAAIAAHGGWNSSGVYMLGDGLDKAFPAKYIDGNLMQQTFLSACFAGDYISENPNSQFIAPDIATDDGQVSSLTQAAKFIWYGSDTYMINQAYSANFDPAKPVMAPDGTME